MITAEFYSQRSQRFQQERKETEKRIRQFAWSRVALAILFLVVIYVGFLASLYFLLLPVLIVGFFFLVQKQTALETHKQLLQNLELLNEAEAKAANNDHSSFPNGERFFDAHHPFSSDLDLFGKGSIHQYLNRTATQLGENRLAHDLAHFAFDKNTILDRQQAVREAASAIEFRQLTWATGKLIDDRSFNSAAFDIWLKEKPIVFGNTFLTIAKWVLPFGGLAAIGAVIYDFSYFTILLATITVFNGFVGIYSKHISRTQNILSKAKGILENYAIVFELMRKQNFAGELLKKHWAVADEASAKVKKFSTLVNGLESGMNFFAKVFGNGLFVYDLHSMSGVEQWRHENADKLPVWFASLAEWDALLSLANLHYNHEEYAFAEFTDDLKIDAVNLGHPLIALSEMVANDLSLGKPARVMLITGANMAGKSTFLRTLGVNYVFANIGAPVCASKWIAPLVLLRSGMRTADSLQDHQSYFFAELHRLKSIMDELRSGKKMLILLDEILKGTNSTDKQQGSRELLKQLKDTEALILLATHDIALGDLAEQFPLNISNACFEGKIEDGQLSFDYKLHPGVAQKANATFLMKQMGIIPNS